VDIQQVIDKQNRDFVFAVNRKLNNVLPEKLVIKFLSEKKDPHKIALIMINTDKELRKPEVSSASNIKPERASKISFQKFVRWIKERVKN